MYFFGDFTRNELSYLTFDGFGQVTGEHPFKPTAEITGDATLVDYIGVGPDGALYYSLIIGEIRRVTHANGNEAAMIASPAGNPSTGNSPLNVTFAATVTDAERVTR